MENAVRDANENAEANHVHNATFEAGRAEFLLADFFRKLEPDVNVVAVVDPPRAGLHPKAIHALRGSQMKNLVYVSCDARAAMQNFINLAKPSSNTLVGDPFIPRKVIPVDLFPHTNHFELIILFERVSMEKLLEKKKE